MAKITQQEDAKDYGDATQEAQDAEALAATAAMEAETTPQLAPPAEEPTEGQPAPEQEPEAAAPRQPLQPRNLMQLVPPSLLFRDKIKNPAKQDRDLALLYEPIASSPYASELTKAILARLKG